MHGVEGRENKKAEKNEKQRSQEKNRNCSAKKTLAYAHAPKKNIVHFYMKYSSKSYCSVRKCISDKV